MKISGLAGLYCHFLGLSHAWMTDGGIAGWLIPSEFMDVNYGQAVKRYLLDRVTLLHIHRFDPNDVQFADALVSSAVVWFRKSPPPQDHTVDLLSAVRSSQSSHAEVARALASEPKWTRFPVPAPAPVGAFRPSRIFSRSNVAWLRAITNISFSPEDEIKSRGLPMEAFNPILPSPRYIPKTRSPPTGTATRTSSAASTFSILNSRRTRLKRRFPALHAYLEDGKARGLHERYLCRHRSLWYGQEHDRQRPIVCTYLGRGDTKSGRPFRFILNSSRATVANVYLAMYPTASSHAQWRAIRSYPPGVAVDQCDYARAASQRGQSLRRRASQARTERTRQRAGAGNRRAPAA